jgi:molybdenum cofactor biosynthesis protein B
LGVEDHKKKFRRARCAVLTISDSRTLDTDSSGRLLGDRLVEAGHGVDVYEILPDENDLVRARVLSLVGADLDVILLTGGTGIAPRDATYEAIEAILERRLDGFGELFRMLSYEQIGSAAMLSRAIAGIVGSTVVFSLPGSTAACALAASRLIIPEISHVLSLLRATT